MNRRRRIHLVCNAHLDPVWQWPWEDGLTEALATFRIAADFCDKYPGFVFNHNESLLYRWVAEFEPRLFARIRRLEAAGRWRISGGAYLQPDINNTSGESHIRQYLYARRFFEKYFSNYPLTAHNYDSFGHAEGLPQILYGCGMRHYVFCRPDYGTWTLPRGAFVWRDRSGASVVARRSDEHYPTFGNVGKKLERFTAHYADEPVSLILWGIGNHGGGPSEKEYREIRQYARKHPELELIDSSADAYFAERLAYKDKLPEVCGELQNSAAGCYTSMSCIKRAHRAAEDLLAAFERLAALGWWHGYIDYPEKALRTAWNDVLFAEFHDILPGSCSQTAERDSLRMLAHAAELLMRERIRCMLPVLRDDPRATAGGVPVFVHNPHAFPLKTQVEFELNLAHMGGMCRDPEIILKVNNRRIPFQRLHAEAAAAGDWRVRLAAEVRLKPWEMLRIDEAFRAGMARKPVALKPSARILTFSNRYLKIKINPRTGLVDWLSRGPQAPSLVKRGSFAPVALRDLDHSWRCGTPRKGISGAILDKVDFVEPGNPFRLATESEALALNPTHESKWGQGRARGYPLRITEDGPLRMMVEAVFVLDKSAVVRTYVIYKRDGYFEIRDRVFWNQRDTMLKLNVPLAFDPGDAVSDAVYSAVIRKPTEESREQSNQRWLAVRGRHAGKAVSLAVASTGSSAHSLTQQGVLQLNVLRSPAYASFNLKPQSEWAHRRFMPRQDIGGHEMCYAVMPAGRFDEATVRKLSALLNMPPVWQVYYPQSARPVRARRAAFAETVTVDCKDVQVAALKRSEDGRHLVVRLLNAAGGERRVKLKVKPYREVMELQLGAYALQTVMVRRGGKRLDWHLADLVERRLKRLPQGGG